MTSGKGYREGAGTWSQLQVPAFSGRFAPINVTNACKSLEWPWVDWRAWNDSALWGQLLGMHNRTSIWLGYLRGSGRGQEQSHYPGHPQS